MTQRTDPDAKLRPAVTPTTNGHSANGHGEHSREELEQRANLVLGELLHRLDVLDDRRQKLQHAGGIVKYEVKRHLPLAAAIGLGAVALGVVVVRLVRVRRDREFRRQVTRAVLGRLVGDDVVEPKRTPSTLGVTLRTAGLRLLVLAGTEFGRRFITHALHPRPVEPTPLLGPRGV